MLDGGAHFCAVCECADGDYVSIGAIQPQFYSHMLALPGLGDDPEFVVGSTDPDRWSTLRKHIEDVFRTQSGGRWCELFDNEDVYFTRCGRWPRRPTMS
jgi:alpha-methylacyl-CoA racemase